MKLGNYTLAISIGAALLAQSGFANTRPILSPLSREAEINDVRKEKQAGDDRHGKGKPKRFARETEPRDDHRGKGEPQPGDDRGGKGKPKRFARETEPRDDHRGKGEPQPGDDRGGKGKPKRFARETEPRDDHRGHGKPLV